MTGPCLIIAGVGVLALNVMNGLYTNETAGSWIKTSGWITAGAFIIGGNFNENSAGIQIIKSVKNILCTI